MHALAFAAPFILLFLLFTLLLPGGGRRLRGQAGELVLDLATASTRVTELRDKCFAAVEKVGELRGMPADKRGDTFAADVRSAIDELTAMDTSFDAMLKIRQSLVDDDVRSRREKEGRGGPEAGTQDHGAADTRSVGARFVDDEGYQAWARSGSGQYEGEVRTLLTTSQVDTPSGGLFMPRGTPFLLPAAVDRRRMFVRDLVSGGTTTLNSVPYIRELNPRTNETGATSVAEGARSPRCRCSGSAPTRPVRKIAGVDPGDDRDPRRRPDAAVLHRRAPRLHADAARGGPGPQRQRHRPDLLGHPADQPACRPTPPRHRSTT
jgi:hypothetical protein